MKEAKGEKKGRGKCVKNDRRAASQTEQVFGFYLSYKVDVFYVLIHQVSK